MNSFELRLARKFFAKALHCPCPQLIPRSGPDGAAIKCFSIYIDKVGKPYLLVRSLSGDSLNCHEWSGQSFDQPITVALSSIDASDVSITHFYGYSEVQYEGLLDFVLGRTFFLPYLKIRAERIVNGIDQYFFNKKKFFTRKRIELLKFLVQRRLEGIPSSGAVELMTDLYSLKWVLHPGKDSQLKVLNFYLDSLVDTGELRRNNHKYELTGEALKAIEIYEEQERKHTESVKIQRRMFWLTLTIVLLTGAQASLYKLPTLLDLSKWNPRHSTSFEPTSAAKPAPATWPQR